MTNVKMRKIVTAGVLGTGLLFTSACGGDTPAPAPGTTAPTSGSSTTSDGSMTEDPTMGTLVGAGCADYAEAVPEGAGSVDGMAQDPVATAASNNPLLTTLTATVTGAYNPDVNLVDTLNSGEFTVFAPVDDAFAAVDPATLETLKTDSATLTSILTYHVLPERLDPADIDGTHTTVQGGDLEVGGSGDNLTVTDSAGNTANVICGGVQTANATVYLIDAVLTPPAADDAMSSVEPGTGGTDESTEMAG